LGFEGSTFERTFYVADAQIDWELSHDASHFCLAPESFLLFFPLKGEKRYRIVGVFPEEFAKSEGEVLYEEIEANIKQEAQLQLDIHHVEWFSTYKVHSRHVSNFGKGRCFLAGDSAHVHTPAGAQGMNTGIQDAYNLAWKIAAVLNGANEALLQTYNEERLENAKNLLQTTDRLFHLGAGDEWYLAFLRTNVVPPLAGHLLSLDVVKNAIFPRISQIGINYRYSSLSEHAGDEHFHVKAGDRMPYFLQDGGSIYNRLRKPQWHRLLFNDAPQSELNNEYSQAVDEHVFLLSPRVKELFGSDQPFQVLLRPDNYIALLSTDVSPATVQVYLNKLSSSKAL
jgi:hypothetical protein